MIKSIWIFIFLILPFPAWALTPIARTDVVPNQRIENGTTFKFGVVAFAKDGITNVSFAIASGTATYTGDSPKTSSSMALNNRLAYDATGQTGVNGHTGWPGVWEYYIEIPSSDFSSDGTFTVTPTVNGSSESRVLSAVTLLVDAGSARSAPSDYDECWVDIEGSDGTGTANDDSDPFPSISTAIAACQTANGGSSDGNIIYLAEDTYDSIGSGTTSTTNEWLTIKNASGASRDNIILNEWGSCLTTTYIKFEGVTLENNGGTLDYFANGEPTNMWVDDCKLLGPGRYTVGINNGNLMVIKGTTLYSTDTYVTDTDRAYDSGAKLVRNSTIYSISEDVFQNTRSLVVNIRIDDQDPGTTGEHADGYQSHSSSGSNYIIYNYYGTDMHYQGLFLRQDQGSGSEDIAFVNMFIEMRGPPRGSNLKPAAIYFDATSHPDWDHFLLWHCTFRSDEDYGSGSYQSYLSTIYHQNGNGEIENSSFIGNIFYELVQGTGGCSEISDLEYGNSYNNIAEYNHYYASATIIGGDSCNYSDPPSEGNPWFRSRAPDSSSGRTTHSHGGTGHPEVLDLTDNTNYVNFGYPDLATEGGDIVDRMPSNVTGIPADVFGNARDSTPDLGAIEYESSAGPSIKSGTGISGSGGSRN